MAGWVQIKSSRFWVPCQAFSHFLTLGSLINQPLDSGAVWGNNGISSPHHTMTKPTEVHPAVAANFGWDIDAASNDNLVTVVRHRIILEEVVMTKEEFNKMNEDVKNDEAYWNEIEWKDAQWGDYCEEQTTYTAFPGDVTSFTDDCVAFLYPNAKWVECFETVKCAN